MAGNSSILSDAIHAGVVLFVVIVATAFAISVRDHSDNIWIVYGSAIAFAAGRAGAAVAAAARQDQRDERQQN